MTLMRNLLKRVSHGSRWISAIEGTRKQPQRLYKLIRSSLFYSTMLTSTVLDKIAYVSLYPIRDNAGFLYHDCISILFVMYIDYYTIFTFALCLMNVLFDDTTSC